MGTPLNDTLLRLLRAPRDSVLKHFPKDEPLDNDRRKTAQQEYEMNAGKADEGPSR